MQRDGLNSSLNFSEYIKTLSEIETEDLNVKLNSCGYQSSDEVSDLLNTVELDLLPIAFKGLDDEKVQELKDYLPQKKQAMYNDDLAGKPQPKREVDNARKLFVDAAKQMEKDGSLNLEDILSGGEMIE